MTFLGMIETVVLHFLSAGTNRDSLRRNLNIHLGFRVFLATHIKINKGFNVLVE